MPEENRALPYARAIFDTRNQLEQNKVTKLQGVPPGQQFANPFLIPFVFSINETDPVIPTQEKPVRIFFTLTNYSGKTVSGEVTGDYGGQSAINNLADRATVTGSVTSIAPKAGKAVQITLQFFQLPSPIGVEFPSPDAEDTITVDIITGYILEVAENWFNNPSYDIRSAGQASQVCHNRTAFDPSNITSSNPTLEWTSILTPNDEAGGNVGASGTVCSTNLKGPMDFHADVPFLHAFYNDWTFYLALDKDYEFLLAPGNKISNDTGANDAKTYANENGVQVPLIDDEESFLEVEMEQGLVSSQDYWPKQGDRVAVFGRWIVDCGHSNYSTEIHPPLMLAVGRNTDDETSVKILGRAFLTGQHFGDGTLLQHMFKDLLTKEGEAALALLFPPALLGISAMEARPPIISPPFSGAPVMAFTIRPPTPRLSRYDKLLLSFHFTVRTGVGVNVISSPYPDEVQVLVIMNSGIYRPATLPPKHDISVSITGFDPNDPNITLKPSDVFAGSIAANPAVGVVLSKGVKTDRYDLPPSQSPHDVENVIIDWEVSGIIPGSVANAQSLDDHQPYPIYGWLTLRWERHEEPPPLRDLAPHNTIQQATESQ